MTELWIDTDRAVETADGWRRRADALAGLQAGVERELVRLELGSVQSAAVQHLAAASTELWVGAAYVGWVVDAILAGDRLGPIDAALLHHRAGARVRRLVLDVCLPVGSSPTFSSIEGDLAGTGSAELRSPFLGLGGDQVERGRRLVARALSDTASAGQIREDEFELVEFADDRFLVVLPGVIDLSSPHLGLDEGSRSVRDLDRHAILSSRSSAIADNAYALAVRDALAGHGVPPGAELMIVGHSFGADTALDLAADPGFNGPDGHRVTHVVAAGYYSDPQLDDVGSDTEVLVLQNFRDAAVLVERAGYGPVTEAAEDARSWWGHVTSGDLVGAWVSSTAATLHGAEAVWDAAGHAWGHADDLAVAGAALALGDLEAAGAAASRVVTLEPRIAEAGPGLVVDVFEGGAEGAGHHPSNYVAHLETVEHDLVTGFLASVGAAGYAGPGTTWALDVSVPGP